MNREEDVAAAPIATSTPRGSFHFAAVPATAGEASRGRRRFIARADRICVRTYDRGHARQAAYARRVAGRPDARERVTASTSAGTPASTGRCAHSANRRRHGSPTGAGSTTSAPASASRPATSR